jgi:IS30 family transposase/transposase-like protein
MSGTTKGSEQKERFFALLDRGGSVRAAADASGVNIHTAYGWVRRAGLTMQRRAPRQYTAQAKAEFLRLAAERSNIMSAARDVGIHRPTAYAWARKAGIFTSEARKVNPRREEFLRLRSIGLTRREAAERVGADSRSAIDWDKGITIIHRGRVYPDGRVVRYLTPTIVGVRPPRPKRHIGGTVDLNRVEKIIHPRYLSLLEREQLKDLHATGLSIRGIAEAMQRSPSTISRELKRNTLSKSGYLPHTAHRLSVQRRLRQRRLKLRTNAELLAYVQARLKKKWSPEQISNRLAKDFPDRPEMQVSTETIYQAIYVHLRGELKRELARGLRRGRGARKPQKKPDARRPRFVDPMRPISERPADVEDRNVPGHWEGDLIVGANQRSAIATLVERSSRFVMLGQIGQDRNADAVRDVLIATVGPLPEALRGTLTWDQGSEMSEHRAFSIATNMDVYFCEPGSPWQRGSNENTNGLLRQYFPKGLDLSRETAQRLQAVADELNDRPRKTLDWETPAERLAALLDAS